MQEVSGVLDGELNYFKLRGDTGPLVISFLQEKCFYVNF